MLILEWLFLFGYSNANCITRASKSSFDWIALPERAAANRCGSKRVKFESSWVSTSAFANLKYAGMWKQALVPVKASYTCILHLCTKRTRIFLLSISRARRGSLEKCAAAAICLSHLSLSFSLPSLDASLTCSFLSFAARLQHTHCRTVGRKQISEGDACRNVSQLISCWRNMAVIKCAFSLYGMHSRGSLGSRNHRVAKLRLENISPWCATWPVVIRIKWCFAHNWHAYLIMSFITDYSVFFAINIFIIEITFFTWIVVGFISESECQG